MSNQDSSIIDPRLSVWHLVRLQITITSGSVSYTTYSENISGGGIKLERVIPPTMRSKKGCRVLIAHMKSRKWVELHGIIISNVDNQQRIAFDQNTESEIENFCSWIEGLSLRAA